MQYTIFGVFDLVGMPHVVVSSYTAVGINKAYNDFFRDLTPIHVVAFT